MQDSETPLADNLRIDEALATPPPVPGGSMGDGGTDGHGAGRAGNPDGIVSLFLLRRDAGSALAMAAESGKAARSIGKYEILWKIAG